MKWQDRVRWRSEWESVLIGQKLPWMPVSVGLFDIVLLTITILMVLTAQTVLFFHLIFVFLSLGAFFWPFRSFVLRVLLWVSVATAEVLNAVYNGTTQPDELIEIPLLTLILLVVFAIAQHRARALDQVRRAEGQAHQARQDLEHSNHELEKRITERSVALNDALTAQRQQADELRHSIAVQRQLNETLLELSIPVIPLHDGVLMVPLVGNLERPRTSQLMEKVLGEFEHRRARVLVLDVTGVPVVDTAVAQAILRVTDAVRLMGGRAILVGIRPEVAQALVSLGADFRSITTVATIQDGLQLLK